MGFDRGAGKPGVEAVLGLEVGADGLEVVFGEFAVVDEEFGDVAVEAAAADGRVAADIDRVRGEGGAGIGLGAFEDAVDPEFEAVFGGVAANGDDLKPQYKNKKNKNRAAEAVAVVEAFLDAVAAANGFE